LPWCPYYYCANSEPELKQRYRTNIDFYFRTFINCIYTTVVWLLIDAPPPFILSFVLLSRQISGLKSLRNLRIFFDNLYSTYIHSPSPSLEKPQKFRHGTAFHADIKCPNLYHLRCLPVRLFHLIFIPSLSLSDRGVFRD
jgi:hypothetical protein